MVEYDRIAEGNDLNFSPADIDHLVNNTADMLHSALDAVAPLRKRVSYLRSSAPWYNSHIRMLKQNARKMERKWYSCKSVDSHCAWKDSLIVYKRALRIARTSYYSSLIEENKHNPRFLFSTVTRLTKSHNSVGPCIPATLSSEDFMSFFSGKIIKIRDEIGQAQLLTAVNVPAASLISSVSDLTLDCFSPVGLSELTSTISKAKPSTCLLDPIPTRLFKDVMYSIGISVLDQINLSLQLGYVPQVFKVAVIKPLLKKPSLDPDILANYRPISNLPFISKIVEKIVKLNQSYFSILESNYIKLSLL